MKIVVKGVLPDAERDAYIKYITGKFPPGVVEKLVLDVQGEYVDIQYTLHRYRDLRKMGGCCIGEPADWNPAKQAELRDTLPNRIEV
ncbi:MAG: hypothetical protein K2O18_13360 [Oscillospiraceae bacterium]|nr:hypothetical protein [Oscillospiraceae bacterium]